MRNILRVATDQHESSSGNPGSVCDSVCRLWLPVMVLDETAPSGGGREQFLHDLESVVVHDTEQILALRRLIVPVDERLPGREEDDEEHRSGLPVAFRSQPLSEPCSFVDVRDRLDFRLGPQDKSLEGCIVLDLAGSCLGLGSPARKHDQCQKCESQRSLAIQCHGVLLVYGKQPGFGLRPDPDSLHQRIINQFRSTSFAILAAGQVSMPTNVMFYQ